MADKCLTESDWKSFAKGQKLDDAKEASKDTKALHEAVLDALQQLAKQDETKHGEMLVALEKFEGSITKQIAANARRKDKDGKAIKDTKDVKDQLYKMLTAVEKQRKDVSAAKDARAEVEEEPDSPALLTTKMIPLIRLVRKGELVLQALIAVAGKETVVLVSRKAISPARGKLLKEQMTNSSGIKFIRGECLYEQNTLTFAVQASAGGLAKRIKAALLQQLDAKLKVRVRGEDPDDIEEEAEDEAVAPGAPASSTAQSKSRAGPPDAATLAFAKRMAALKVEVDKLSARGDWRAEQLEKWMKLARQNVVEGDLKGGNDELTRLEEVLAEEMAHDAATAGAAQASKRPGPPDAATLAFAKRLLPLKVQVDKLSVGGAARATPLQALVDAARQKVKAGDLKGGNDVLTALEKQLSAPGAAAGRSAAPASPANGDAPMQRGTAKAPPTNPALAFRTRLTEMVPRMKPVEAAGGRIAALVKAKRDEAVELVRQKGATAEQLGRAMALLGEIDALLAEADASEQAGGSVKPLAPVRDAASEGAARSRWVAEQAKFAAKLNEELVWIKGVVASKTPEALEMRDALMKAELELQAVLRRSRGVVETADQAVEMAHFLGDDDVVSAVCEYTEFDIQPLLGALQRFSPPAP